MRSILSQANRSLNKIGGNTFNPAWGRNYEGWLREEEPRRRGSSSNLLRQSNVLWLMASCAPLPERRASRLLSSNRSLAPQANS